MNSELVFAKNPHILSSEIDRDVVIMDLASASYYTLNSTASEIWRLLDSKRTVSSIFEELCSTHRVVREEIETEVFDLFKDLEKSGLIELQERA